MKEIELFGRYGKGTFALVDDADFEELNRHHWHATSRGYAARSYRVKGKKTLLLMHRLIANTPQGSDTDHLNHNKLDNRKSNLRVCSHAENMANRTYKGNVSWRPKNNKWIARIQLKDVKHYLGYFTEEADAWAAIERTI